MRAEARFAHGERRYSRQRQGGEEKRKKINPPWACRIVVDRDTAKERLVISHAADHDGNPFGVHHVPSEFRQMRYYIAGNIPIHRSKLRVRHKKPEVRMDGQLP